MPNLHSHTAPSAHHDHREKHISCCAKQENAAASALSKAEKTASNTHIPLPGKRTILTDNKTNFRSHTPVPFAPAPQSVATATTPDNNQEQAAAQDQLTGIVLAGGLSSRLGKDKAAIHLYGEHEPDLLARTCNLLHSVTDEVWISGRSGSNHGASYLWIPDEVQGVGPVAGIMSALRTAQGPILVLSCDLPFMDQATLERLIAARNNRPENTLMTTFVQEETGFIEALVAIYELSALTYFEQAIEDGVYKISRTIPKEGQHTVPYARRDSLPFFNVNYPADLEMARRVISSL